MFDLRRFLRKPAREAASQSPPGASRDAVTLLAILRDERDGEALRSIASSNGWRISIVDSSSRAMLLLQQPPTPLVICDGDLGDEDWRAVFGKITALPYSVCILLASRVVDDYLWQQVIENHGYDVVAKPFQPDALRQTVLFAWSWRGWAQRS